MKQGVSIMGEHDPSKYELDLNVYPKIVTKELPVAFERGGGRQQAHRKGAPLK